MELTITQNGALYALQHPGTDIIRGARIKRANTHELIRADELPRASLFVWYKLKLHI